MLKRSRPRRRLSLMLAPSVLLVEALLEEEPPGQEPGRYVETPLGAGALAGESEMPSSWNRWIGVAGAQPRRLALTSPSERPPVGGGPAWEQSGGEPGGERRLAPETTPPAGEQEQLSAAVKPGSRKARPHRHLVLTLPTGLVPVPVIPADGQPAQERVEAAFYIDPQILTILEEEWWRRQMGDDACSRSEIVNAAVAEALAHPERLTAALKQFAGKAVHKQP